MTDASDTERDEQPSRQDSSRRDCLTSIDRREYLQYTGTVAGVPFIIGVAQGDRERPAVTEQEGGKIPVPVDLRTEYEREPTNLSPSTDHPPRLSWRLPAGRTVEQTAYRIRVATDVDVLPDDGNVWDSGRVNSNRSTTVEYDGEALESDTTYHWVVRIWDGDGEASDWSEPTSFTTAITEDQWAGEWAGVDVGGVDSINNTEQNLPAELEEGETLGQSFTIEAEFDLVTANVPTWSTTDSDVTFSLYEAGPDGDLVGEERFENVDDNSWVELTFEEPIPPGEYYLEQSDLDGTIGWWSHTDDVLEDGQAFENGEPVDGDRTLRVESGDPTDSSPLLRTGATLDGSIESARAHVVTLGYGELYVNGERVGDEQLNPAWTKYEDRVLYSSHDVTDSLESGENAIGLWLGRGWYSKGNHELPARIPNWEAYGPPRGLLQLTVTYADGTTESITTDASWTTSPSPITQNDIYDGETYDAREEHPGWAGPGFDDGDWDLVDVLEPPSEDYELRPQRLPPIQVTKTLEPESIDEREDDYLIDFGQNLAGWVELTIADPDEGDEIVLRHAETIDDEDELVTVDLRDAEATDRYVARGAAEEVYEPRFTYHGFRYVTVEGYPGELTAADVVSKAVHTGLEETGSFTCSNEDLNRVQQNAVWGLRSNAHGIPTDCCQRDERFGWTGDVHQNARADFYNFDAVRYHEKWMRDHDDDQREDGTQSDAIPHAVSGPNPDPNWAKTRVLVPWKLYLHTGDQRLLADRYEGMRDYVDFWHESADEHIVPEEMAHYGDWLSVEDQRSDPSLFGTFAHYETTTHFARIAAVLEHDDDAAEYRERANAIAAAFHEEFFDPETNSYGTGTQTTYVLPLSEGIVPDEHEKVVVEALVEKIREVDDGKLQTGFIGTRPLIYTLVEHGHEELAYNIVSQPEYPGWVYMVRQGATTMWEHWDSDEQVGSGMNSLNHRPWTLVSEWFYRVLAGIDVGEPGYEHVEIAPTVVDDLEWAEAETETVRGTVASRWERVDTSGAARERDGLALEVTVPGNSTATVEIPTLGGESVRVRESGKPIWTNGNRTRPNHPGIENVSREDGRVVVGVGAGEYDFELEQLGDQ